MKKRSLKFDRVKVENYARIFFSVALVMFAGLALASALYMHNPKHLIPSFFCAVLSFGIAKNW